MENKEEFKSGFVSILGRPNVGKSTLLNALLGEKVSIVSDIPQTTRYQVRGVLNMDKSQIVFVDTPGIHSFKQDLARHLNTVARKSVQDAEVILYVVDVSRGVGREEQDIIKLLLGLDRSVKLIMVLNKIDLGTGFLNQYMDNFNKMAEAKGLNVSPVQYFIPVSAKKQKNLDRLKDVIVELLPVQPPFYGQDQLTDFPRDMRICDIIREKLFFNCKEELPYSVAVDLEAMEDRGRAVYIKTVIYVNRVSQKKIVIGKSGEFLKQVGILSRKEIEKIFLKKVFLELEVRVLRDWQSKERILKKLGYWWR